MQMSDISTAIEIFKSKGWDATYAYVYMQISADGQVRMTSYTFYPLLTIGETRELEYPTKSFYDPEPAALFRWANEAPSTKQFRLGKLLETIKEAQLLGEELAVPADFISPLTLMAEQLSTNILEDKRAQF